MSKRCVHACLNVSAAYVHFMSVTSEHASPCTYVFSTFFHLIIHDAVRHKKNSIVPLKSKLPGKNCPWARRFLLLLIKKSFSTKRLQLNFVSWSMLFLLLIRKSMESFLQCWGSGKKEVEEGVAVSKKEKILSHLSRFPPRS